MANVEIQWDFDKNIKKYRFETFCYGPKACKFYKMGRPRSVPYKNRGSAIRTWTKLSRKWLKANQNKAFTVKDFGEMQR